MTHDAAARPRRALALSMAMSLVAAPALLAACSSTPEQCVGATIHSSTIAGGQSTTVSVVVGADQQIGKVDVNGGVYVAPRTATGTPGTAKIPPGTYTANVTRTVTGSGLVLDLPGQSISLESLGCT